ncbi:MAG: (2Fe-2S)-binding protein [Bacteroidota bacterium]
MTIDRCLCYNTSFADMAEEAACSGAATIPDLQDEIVFGHGCTLCHPYVRRMLRTGETVFHEIVTEESEPEEAEGP